MRSPAFVVSALIHGVVAAALIMAANKVEVRKAIAIAVVGEKKKEPKPPAPKPRPRPELRPEEPKPPPRVQAAMSPRASSSASQAPASAAPEMSSLVISNDDAPGVEIPVARAVAPTKVASLTPRLPQARRERQDAEQTCDEPLSKPVPVNQTVEIEYSPQARAEGVEGRLVLRLTIAADGTVERVEVVSGVHPTLDAMAVASVKQWRFRPAQACGRPVGGGTYTLARKFELGD